MARTNTDASPQVRLLVVALVSVCILAIILMVLLVRSNRAHTTEAFVQQYPYIDISRHFVPQEHYLTTLEPLRDRVQQLVAEYGSDSVSVYIEYLNTGANIAINQDTYIWPASFTKIPVAMAVMKKIEEGEWELSNELVLLEGDANDESGNVEHLLADYPVGTRFTIETLLRELLVNSDNTAFFILGRNLTDEEIERVTRDLGLDDLFTKDGRMSSKEYSRFFRALYTASFLNRENSQYLLQLLDEATFNDFLSPGVPETVSFSHKYGEKLTINVYSDSGIVYVPHRPYLITVMVQGRENEPHETERPRAASLMQAISRVTYEYFSTQ